MIQFGDQPVGLSNIDKTIRAEKAMFRVLPTDQCLQLGDSPQLQVDDGLVVQKQPGVFIQRLAQFLFDLQFQ